MMRWCRRNNSRFLRASTLLCAVWLLAIGCAAQVPLAEEAAPERPHRIHVVRHGWHAGIVVRAADVPPDAWPARREFADAELLEVGWGDRAYYQSSDPSLWLGLRALLWPSPGVLHIVAFSGAPEHEFPAAEVITLQVSAQGLARLINAVAASHEMDANGKPIALGPGLYGNSRFYASRDRFHLLATCNAWTAALLRQAGVPLGPLRWPSAKGLFTLLRQHQGAAHATALPAAPLELSADTPQATANARP